MSERSARRLVIVTTTLMVSVLTADALQTLASARSSVANEWLFAALLAVPGVMVVQSVAQPNFTLSWAAYWTWSFVFLGLAPVYQVSAGHMPWEGVFSTALLLRGAHVVLIGHAVVIAVAVRRRGSSRQLGAGLAGATPRPGLARFVRAAVAVQVTTGVLFAAAMGPTSMVAGKFAFQARLLEVAQLPAGGTLYFLATGLACIVPASAILIRRAGGLVPRLSTWVSVLVGAVVTNPFIGSRFLTGSFLLATVGAALAGRTSLRLVPSGIIAVFAFIFPSLDLWRGDGTGSSGVAFAVPRDSFLNFDYDAFEMLVRGLDVKSFSPDILEPALRSVVGAVVHWIPLLTDMVPTEANSGTVAGATGMAYRNVSMPLVGEGYLLAGWLGVVLFMGLLGLLLRGIVSTVENASVVTGFLMDAPVAALLFIVLRGSIYGALGYLLLAIAFGVVARVVGLARPHVAAPGSCGAKEMHGFV